MRKKDLLLLYVQQNARFIDESVYKPYFVRFPSPFSATVFFSKDTSDLVDQLIEYTRKGTGRIQLLNGKWLEWIKLDYEDDENTEE